MPVLIGRPESSPRRGSRKADPAADGGTRAGSRATVVVVLCAAALLLIALTLWFTGIVALGGAGGSSPGLAAAPAPVAQSPLSASHAITHKRNALGADDAQ